VLVRLSVSLAGLAIVELDDECDIPVADATVAVHSDSAVLRAIDVLVFIVEISHFGLSARRVTLAVVSCFVVDNARHASLRRNVCPYGNQTAYPRVFRRGRGVVAADPKSSASRIGHLGIPLEGSVP
jgi:hypothetical protein